MALCALVLVLASPVATCSGVSKRVPVFTWGEAGYPAFREPAILLLPAGKLLAFSEGGQNHLPSSTSSGAIATYYPNSNSDVVSKLSADGGATWGPLNVVLRNASQPGAVWDTVHQRVVLNLNGAPHCLAVSDGGGCGFNLQMTSPDGLKWSPPVALDRFLGSQGHAAAGHAGLELHHPGPHKDRLLFIGHRGAYVEDAVWFTDDGGASYRTSAHTLAKMDEAQLVENRNGTIIANMRWKGSPAHGRGIATSTDGGATFSTISYDAQLRTPVCQATIWQSPQNGDIYYAAPSSELDGFPDLDFGRTHGTVRRSKTGLPGEWQGTLAQVTLPCMHNYSSHLCDANASTVFGYSCLTDVPQKGKGGLLWESVRATVFTTFDLDF